MKSWSRTVRGMIKMITRCIALAANASMLQDERHAVIDYGHEMLSLSMTVDLGHSVNRRQHFQRAVCQFAEGSFFDTAMMQKRGMDSINLFEHVPITSCISLNYLPYTPTSFIFPRTHFFFFNPTSTLTPAALTLIPVPFFANSPKITSAAFSPTI